MTTWTLTASNPPPPYKTVIGCTLEQTNGTREFRTSTLYREGDPKYDGGYRDRVTGFLVPPPAFWTYPPEVQP